jgi:hypothetical protein
MFQLNLMQFIFVASWQGKRVSKPDWEFPITTNGVLAVLVFYMFESQDEDQQLIELISASTELGLMIQRKQAEGEIRKALERKRNSRNSNLALSP